MFGRNIAIDLGSSTISFFVEGKGIVVTEPCVAALETQSGRLLAAGSAAVKMVGRTPDYITVVNPVTKGVISNYTVTEQMLCYFLKKICGHSLFKPKVMVCMPGTITSVEERTIIDVLTQAGARRACIIQKPLAAALGVNIDVSRPHGAMIADIGGGTTDIAVITLDRIAVTKSLKVAGKDFDAAIIRYIRKKYDILIGELTAQSIKEKIGSAYPREVEIGIGARGQNYITGMPVSFEVTSTDVYDALQESMTLITDAVCTVLEKTPPELIGDIYSDGIVLAGGSSLLYGIDRLLTEKTGVKCRVAEDPMFCVAHGAGIALKDINRFITGDYRFETVNDLNEQQ